MLNMSIPEWGDKIYPQPLFNVGALHYSLFTHTPLMKKLEIGKEVFSIFLLISSTKKRIFNIFFLTGPLLKQIISSMTKKTDARSYLKQFHIYSTHTAILVGLLNTLGVYNNILPEPASALLIELRKKENKYIVTVSENRLISILISLNLILYRVLNYLSNMIKVK